MRDLVIFGDDWGRHPSSTQYLARYLASGRKVLWVNSLGLRAPRLSMHDLARIGGKISALFRSAMTKKPAACKPTAMQVVEPFPLPFHRNKLTRDINRFLLRRRIRKAMKASNIIDPILWVTTPSGALAIDQLQEHAVVYYCADDFAAWPGTDPDAVRHFETLLGNRADLFLAASDELVKRFPANMTHLVPHGVDSFLFSKPAEPASQLVPTRPTAGFYGSTFDRLDVDLLVYCAKKLSNWDFVFIGQPDSNLDMLQSLPNCRFLGPKNIMDLPSFSQHWTASILPFRKTPEVLASNPLKLREYLAAGSPVVSTDIPALNGYRDLVHTADTPGQFVDALLDAWVEGKSRAEERRNRIARESWEYRAATVEAYLKVLG